ncbi:MAG: hypothetical protein ACTSUE_11500 [Promethearchaeota archaeon]
MKQINSKIPALRAMRPPKTISLNQLPSREDLIVRKKSPLTDYLNNAGENLQSIPTKSLTITDEILLSLVWNNALLQDIPIIGASNSEQADAKKGGSKKIEDRGSDETPVNSIDGFLRPMAVPEMMVNPNFEAMVKNNSSLLKYAVNSGLRQILRRGQD